MLKTRKMDWLAAGAVLSFAIGVAGGAYAADAAKPRMAKPRTPSVPARVIKGIEDKLGKPLTTEQKDQLNAAFNAREEAIKAAREKSLSEYSRITGISVEDLAAIEKPVRKAPKADGATGAATTPAAPAAAPAGEAGE